MKVEEASFEEENEEEFQSASEGEDEMDEASTLAKKKKLSANRDINNVISTSSNPSAQTNEEIIEASYLKYQIMLSRIQIMLINDIKDLEGINSPTKRNENENKLIYEKYYILTPLDLFLKIHQCVYRDDLKLPTWKLFGNLPIIELTLTDAKLESIIELAMSIPVPKSNRENDSLETETLDELLASDYNKNNQTDWNESNIIDTIKLV